MNGSSTFAVPVLACALCLAVPCEASADLIILGNFIGGEQKGSSFGGGNIVDIFDAAAAAWESVIRDDFTLRIDYGWGPDPGGYHFLTQQGGDPNRETAGTILVNPQIFNDGTYAPLYMDPNPSDNAEFTSYQETAEDFGGGSLNTGRILQMAVAGIPYYLDLYTVISHELGHALGMSNANVTFVAEAADGGIDVYGPQPYAGSYLPLATNNFGVTSHLAIQGAVMTGLFPNGRQLLSDADILATAQLGGWTTTLSPAPAPTPEPATAFLVGTAILAIVSGRRYRRKRPQ